MSQRVQFNIYFKSRDHQILLRGIILAVAVGLFSLSEFIFKLHIPFIRYIVNFISLSYLVYGFYKTRQISKVDQKIPSLLIIIFVLWTFVTIAWGIPDIISGEDKYRALKQFLSGNLILAIFPLIMFTKPNLWLYRHLFRFCLLLSGVYLLITIPQIILSFENISFSNEPIARYLSAGASVLLLTYYYNKSRTKTITIITLFSTLFIMAVLGRRNMVLYFSSIIFLFSMIQLFSRTSFMRRRRQSSLFIVISIIAFGFLFIGSNIDKFTFLGSRFATGFQSREVKIEKFTDDFNKSPVDWWIGRGIFGKFESGIGKQNKNNDLYEGIENGYLNHVLKEGALYLVLIIFFGLYAAYLGFFRSNNLLSKAFAALILTYFIDMIGFGIPELNIKYFIVWIAISGCISRSLREQPDELIIKIIKI